jgi:predicted membrane channel-forming protein YqfA (hemolysin III family)
VPMQGAEAPKEGNGRRETELERCDRNLVELLQEVRVAQTGVQVLFAFLLAVAFTPRFAQASTFERIDYFATLIASGAAAVFLIAPTSYHRLLFRRGDKEYLVDMANRFVIAGLACVAVSMIGVVLLVSDLLFGSIVAAATAGAAAACCIVTWYALPLARRRRLERERPEGKRDAAAPTGLG